jgi:hypothetical protein
LRTISVVRDYETLEFSGTFSSSSDRTQTHPVWADDHDLVMKLILAVCHIHPTDFIGNNGSYAAKHRDLVIDG